MTKITYVYEFLYNDDTNDSGASTVSIHRTRKGAEEAKFYHKANVKLEFLKNLLWYKENDPEWFKYYKKKDWKWAKWWGVRKVELKD